MQYCSRVARSGGQAVSAVFLLLFLLWPALAFADPGAAPADLGSMVVTSTRVPTRIKNLGSSLTVITADDIRAHQWRTLPQALKSVPGLDVVQSGGPGGLTSVFIRGANSNQTKVLIDGVVANDPSANGGFEFGQILLADIKRVEVLRGPESSLYGSDAIGGVINIITKKGNGPTKVDARVEGGSFDTFNQSAGVRGSDERVHYRFNVAHYHSGNTPVTPLNLLPPGHERQDDAYDNTTLSTRLGVDTSDTTELDFGVRYNRSKLDFTSNLAAGAQSVQADHDLYAFGGFHFTLLDGSFKNRIRAAFARHRRRIQSPATAFGPTPPVYNRGSRAQYSWQGKLALTPGQKLVLGLDAHSDWLDDSPISARNSDKAAYAEIQSHLTRRLIIAASARYDHNDLFGGKSTGRLAGSYTVATSGTHLKASYGTGFKAPSLTDLFVSYPAFNFFANPDLQPEESTGYDIGFEQPLSNDDIRFGVTWFHNDIKNLIVTNAKGTSLANIGRAKTHGVESFLEIAPSDAFQLKLAYTYTVAENALTGRQLRRRPKNKATLDATWRPTSRLSVATTFLYVGSWIDANRDASILRLKAHPYFLVGIAAHYRLGSAFTLFARVNNLFDRQYQQPVGFLHPGRGVYAGVRFHFGGA
jgi:vitamin B12 transporter